MTITIDRAVVEQALEALEFIDQALPWPAGRQAKDAITALRAALAQRAEPVTEDMKSAVRWAPSSAYWSQRLREFFGPDAREGIAVLERRLAEAQQAEPMREPDDGVCDGLRRGLCIHQDPNQCDRQRDCPASQRLHAENERLHQINQSHEMKLSVRGYEIQIADLEAQRDALLEALKFYAFTMGRRKSDNEPFYMSALDLDCGDRARAAIKKAEGEKT